MDESTETNRIYFGDGRFAFDVFHCRERYIGIVAPYYSRSVFAEVPIRIAGQDVEWFVLPDSRQFTMSLLVKVPWDYRNCDTWEVQIGGVRIQVRRPTTEPRRLAMATMVRFDAPYLVEWIHHHRRLGFEHFYLYNHENVSEVSSVLSDFREYVTEIAWAGPYSLCSAWQEPFLPLDSHCYTQCTQQMHAALKYGDNWDWMGFFDADEFLCPVGGKSILDILSMAEQRAFGEIPFVRTTVLEVKGKWFGTAGQNGRAVESVVARYTRAERGHTCGTKCFVQPQCVSGSVIHYWDTDGQTGRVPDNLLRFNHYRALSPFKNRVGKRFDDEYTNEIEDRTILEIGQ